VASSHFGAWSEGSLPRAILEERDGARLRDCDHCPTDYRLGPYVHFGRAAMNRALGDQCTRGPSSPTTVHRLAASPDVDSGRLLRANTGHRQRLGERVKSTLCCPISPGTGDEHHKAGVGPTGRMRQNRSYSRSFLRTQSLKSKRVSPHVLRHSAEMELLQAGVDGALRHSSLRGTNRKDERLDPQAG
jgi:hypothetical protein